MRIYRFVLRNDVGDNEDLGCLALTHDDEAFDFACETIRLIMLEAAPQYSGSAIEITEGGRAVGSVPFAVETGQRQKKFG